MTKQPDELKMGPADYEDLRSENNDAASDWDPGDYSDAALTPDANGVSTTEHRMYMQQEMAHVIKLLVRLRSQITTLKYITLAAYICLLLLIVYIGTR